MHLLIENDFFTLDFNYIIQGIQTYLFISIDSIVGQKVSLGVGM